MLTDAALAGALLVVDKPKMLSALDQLRAAPSLNGLRSAITALLDRLDEPPAEPTGELVELGRAYLLEEFNQISQSLTLERAHYYLDRLEKSFTKVKTSSINDINLNRWKEYSDIYTDSLWLVARRDRSGVHRADYWGNFVPQIPNQLLKRYTKQGDWVLDTFAGSGTTLVESQRLGRHSLGVELQPAVAQQSRQLLLEEANPHNVTSQIVTGDSTSLDYRQLLASLGQPSVQLLIMHPPYFDIIKFSPDQSDLSNAPTVEDFLTGLGQVIDRAGEVLQRGRYFALVIGDKFSKGEWIPLGFMSMNEVLKRDFLLKSIIVKNFEETQGKRNQKELWKYRALVGGFYIFKHEYIFLFKKK